MIELQHRFTVMTYDIDFAGVVSNISYVRWLEDLRNLYAAQALPLATAQERGIAPVLLRTEVDYLAAARLQDTLDARMWLAEKGRARFVLAAEFVRCADGAVAARARQTGTFISLETLRPVRLPDEYTHVGPIQLTRQLWDQRQEGARQS
ncbi:MAG TPA: thioesterase family protein [Anaerolineales bacterium]|nr:thioesterase family protein [Anaerolineales bacterium]HRF47098.1 thioesterase family protein [Anaerolineales bacterium]